MEPKWNDTQPIYRQLRDRVVAMILEDVVGDGDALPSVRQVAAEYQLNPLTVMKGYQSLVDEDLVEKKRGRGMYVKSGAKALLLSDERNRFLQDTWPSVAATIRRLGLSLEELIAAPAPTAEDHGALAAGGAAPEASAANDDGSAKGGEGDPS
ncbi:MAG: GntR family transcriptional regulator [Pseudomonadota bacterium]